MHHLKSRFCRIDWLTSFFIAATLLTASIAQAGPTALEQQVIDLVNIERSKVGLSSLAWQQRLAIAARCHATDMATNDYFTHNSQDGTTPVQRIEKAGYVWGAWGENIAAGQVTAQEVMDAWMNSALHRANILSSNFTEIGIGYAYNSKSTYQYYWVQDFGAPWTTPHNAPNNYCAQSSTSNPAALIPTLNLLLN